MNPIEYREIIINPRVIKHLGIDLITTPDVAVTELIKNSLDAKAFDIRLHIFNGISDVYNNNVFQFGVSEEIADFLPKSAKNQNIFIIEDNGIGMNEKQLNNGFLEIGTEIKLKNEDTLLGEKGIGRLATQRLGNCLLIETASAKEDYATLTFIDWSGIGKPDKKELVPSVKIKKVAEHYTRLWILGINNQDFLEIPQQLTLDLGEEIRIPVNRELKSAINFLISPFDNLKGNTISMYFGRKKLNIDFDLQMLRLSESLHSFILSTNGNGEVSLVYSLNLEPWFLERVHRAMVKPEAFKRLKKSHGFYKDLLEANRERIDAVLSKYMSEKELIDLFSDVYMDLYEKAIVNKEVRKEYSEQCAQKLLNNIHPVVPIKGEIYSYKQNPAIGEHIIIESVNEMNCLASKITLGDLKDFLTENNGIKLYRNRYRIGYLGNKENDWLKLQQFRTKGQQWYRFDLGNTVGYVSINDEKQEYIREVSSRLEIIQNDTSESFKLIVSVVFNKLFYELNRHANSILRVIFEENGLLGESLKKQVRRNLNDIADASKKSQTVFDRLQKAIELINDESKKEIVEKELINKIAVIMQETSDHIEHEKKVQQQATMLLNEAREQLKSVEVEAYNNFKLMANGLITETITHELDSVCKTSKLSDVAPHFEYLKEYFVINKEVGMFNKHVNPIRKGYDAISNKMQDVGNLYNFLEKTFIKKGTYDEFEYQNIAELVKNIEDNLLQLKEEAIEIECKTNDLEWFVPKGVLIHVFYNLFTNSAFWIDRRRKYAQDDSRYSFNMPDKIVIDRINSNEIIVYDTGTGIIRNMEDILFQPLESGKPSNEGRGMGLYIVQQLLRSFSADIQLLDERNQYDNKYKFLLTLEDEED